MKFLENATIRMKLLIGFLIAVILASISGIVGLVSVNQISSKYEYALRNYGFSQGDVGKCMAMLGRIDVNVHDAISFQNDADSEAARNKVPEYLATMDEYLKNVEKTCTTADETTTYKDAVESWSKYVEISDALMQEGAVEDAEIIKGVQEKLVDQLDPVYREVYDDLAELLDVNVETGTELDEELDTNRTVLMIVVVAVIALSALIALGLGTYLSSAISGSIKKCVTRLQLLAKGDFNTPVPPKKFNDEAGMLIDATGTIVDTMSKIVHDVDYLLVEMGNGNFRVSSRCRQSYVGDFANLLDSIRYINKSLSSTLMQINQSADQVSGGAEQVSNGAQALSQGATEQAASIEELSATVADITTNIKKNADDAKRSSELSSSTAGEVLNSNKKMKEMIEAMNEISGKASEISKIIKAIDDIAFQTNILALNAAVEAARAGSAGKGFAVVADEVRNLAQKSADAARNTSELIDATVTAVERGSRIADETAQALQTVVEQAQIVTNTIIDIAAASEIQATGAMQINTGIDQIAAVVQTNSATAQESAAASEEFSGQAQMLKNLIEKFKLRMDTDDTVKRTTNFTEESIDNLNRGAEVADDKPSAAVDKPAESQEDAKAISELLGDNSGAARSSKDEEKTPAFVESSSGEDSKY